MKRQGFTLLELSIVLVIIGLIIGGVTVGKDLIRAAELNSTIATMNEIKLAEQTFRLKYNALAGDIANAMDYELHLNEAGVNTSCSGANISLFNGDGDGVLESYQFVKSFDYDNELTNYFVHMSNAGFLSQTIEGNKTVNAHCKSADFLVFAGLHYPAVPVGDGVIVVSDSVTRKRYFVVGGMGGSHSYAIHHLSPGGSFNDDLLPETAKQIDDKLDDGKALSGQVRVSSSANGYKSHPTLINSFVTFDDADSATNCVYNGDYNLNYETEACTLFVEAGR